MPSIRKFMIPFLASLTLVIPAATADELQDWQTMVSKSVDYLRVRGQADDGSFSKAAGIGPTGLVTAALLNSGVSPKDPVVAKALNFLEQHVQKNGGIYRADSLHRNYDTCIAMVAFAKAGDKARYGKILERAEAFVKDNQMDEGEGKDPSNVDYGGAGYGKHKRPDLSNTSYLVDALRNGIFYGERKLHMKDFKFSFSII